MSGLMVSSANTQ